MAYGKLVRQIGVVTTIPMILAAGPLVGFWIGQWVDGRFQTGPWGMVGLSVLGFVAGVKQVVTLIKRLIKESESEGN